MFCRFLKGFSEWKPSKICSGEEGARVAKLIPAPFFRNSSEP